MSEGSDEDVPENAILPWEQSKDFDIVVDNEQKEEVEAKQITEHEVYFDLNDIDYSVKRNIFRNVVVILDMSYSMSEIDMKPSRLEIMLSHLRVFIRQYFHQNPLSMVSIVASHDKKVYQLSPLSRHAEDHLKAIDKLQCSGGFSLQLSLEMAMNSLGIYKGNYSNEIICLISSLNTFDRDDIFITLKKLEDQRIKCSILCLSGEVYIYNRICEATNGEFFVPDIRVDIQRFLDRRIIPPPVTISSERSHIKRESSSDIVEIGFPQLVVTTTPHVCCCHLRLGSRFYQCPRCTSYLCDLPIVCPICNLLLVDYINLSRSHHYLFPPKKYIQVKPMIEETASTPIRCFACACDLIGEYYECTQCQNRFCSDCDRLVHGGVYYCPGCLQK